LPIARVKKEITFGAEANHFGPSVTSILKLKKGKLVRVVSNLNQRDVDVRVEISFNQNVDGDIVLEKSIQARIFKEYFEIVKEDEGEFLIPPTPQPKPKNKKLNFIKHT
jgi:hypothetical protein